MARLAKNIVKNMSHLSLSLQSRRVLIKAVPRETQEPIQQFYIAYICIEPVIRTCIRRKFASFLEKTTLQLQYYYHHHHHYYRRSILTETHRDSSVTMCTALRAEPVNRTCHRASPTLQDILSRADHKGIEFTPTRLHVICKLTRLNYTPDIFVE